MIRIYRHSEAPPLYRTELHTHQEHELYFLISGQRRYFIHHSIYDLSPGNMTIIPKGVLHKTVSQNHQGYDRFVLFFSDEDLHLISDALGAADYEELLKIGCIRFPLDVAEHIAAQLKQMHREYTAKTPLCSVFLSAQLQLILLTVLRSSTPQPVCTENTAEKVQMVARYINQNFRFPLTLHDAAQMACLEDTYFSKQFKALTGFGFLDYLTQIRIQEAQRLLSCTDLPLGDISDLCGFSCRNYFGDVFKRYTGLSPTAYRKANKA